MSTIDQSLLAAISSEYGVDNSDVEIETTDDEDKSGGVTKSTESESKRKRYKATAGRSTLFSRSVGPFRSLRTHMRMKNMCLFCQCGDHCFILTRKVRQIQ
ncbi:hypothetical protein M5689_006259 [Euphorbia peplus]|nr:hypothetical protein M5689_006259 [Euphorbia peplus]